MAARIQEGSGSRSECQVASRTSYRGGGRLPLEPRLGCRKWFLAPGEPRLTSAHALDIPLLLALTPVGSKAGRTDRISLTWREGFVHLCEPASELHGLSRGPRPCLLHEEVSQKRLEGGRRPRAGHLGSQFPCLSPKLCGCGPPSSHPQVLANSEPVTHGTMGKAAQRSTPPSRKPGSQWLSC